MVSSPSSPSAESDDSRFYDDVRYTDRPVPSISLRHFDARIDSITAEITAAAERHGFFALVNHGIPQAVIDAQFAAAKYFFALPDEVKAKTPFDTDSNAGWEQTSAVTAAGAADGSEDKEKETYQVHLGEENMETQWVADTDLPGFRPQSLSFMQACHVLSTRLMVCLARGLGLTDDNAKDDHVFVKAHDPDSSLVQSGLRLQKYFATADEPTSPLSTSPPSPSARSTGSRPSARSNSPTPPAASAGMSSSDYLSSAPRSIYRGGSVRTFSDNAFLTLRFLCPGQSGLEICQGRKCVTDCIMDAGSEWTKIDPAAGEIICSVGDLLMLWSDDRYKSALYRERAPADRAVDHFGDCYSLAYINQPSRDCVVQGPLRVYPEITAGAFVDLAGTHNLAELAEKKKQKAFAETIAATSTLPTTLPQSHYHTDASMPASTFGTSAYIESMF
ncbi:hypothetical protein SBRCBS47491_006258 [Sporothrix bragantina]|uniref:Non-haem dioxygenase N-terminal domain-containing protein n=1 Tax=Sporothrix bragantina TaxID=671064 RepID=A0ABP0C3V0_9PEZI